MLSRKHYKAISKIIKDNSTKEVVSARLVCLDIAHELQRYFISDNPRFNQQKFIDACKGE